jgi:transposase
MEPKSTLFPIPQRFEEEVKPSQHASKVRLKHASRHQIEFSIGALDNLIAPDHKARLVVAFVEKLDVSNILGTIQSVENGVGRPATDPKILLALWLYATLEGIISARTIADYCKEHIAFQWICGKVTVCHHTLSNFSLNYTEQLSEFLTESIAILMKQGFVDLEEVAQDGMRVRANAGSSSFKTEKSLREHYEKAKKYLAALREELKRNPEASRSRKQAAALRAAREREEQIASALKELKKLRETKCENGKKNRHKPTEKELLKVRISETDPEARVMKMPDNGFRPAYNVQFATTTKHKIIVGVDVSNQGNDAGLMESMISQVEKRCGELVDKLLADGGFTTYKGIEDVETLHKKCKVYTPVKSTPQSDKDPHSPQPGDSEVIIKWRKRMATEEAKEIYKRRSSTAEFSNAQSRNKGLLQFLVRGIDGVKGVVLLFALAHNMQRLFSLGGW